MGDSIRQQAFSHRIFHLSFIDVNTCHRRSTSNHMAIYNAVPRILANDHRYIQLFFMTA